MSGGGLSAEASAGLEALSRLSVFFGHQSVGANVVQGLRELAAEAGSPARVFGGLGLAEGPGLRDALIGRNGDPLSKIADFERMAIEGPGASADLALMKLCYVDLTASADVGAIFEAYRSALDRIGAARPGLILLHVTAPLTTAPGGAAVSLKRLLGRNVDADNRARESYNARLREAFGPEGLLFDLALREAEGGDGTVLRVGRAPALRPEYSDDGGHLNGLGRRKAAEAFLAALGRAAARGKA